MTAIVTPVAPSTTADRSPRTPSLWRAGTVAGIGAAAATVAIAASAHAAHVPIETAPGNPIPVLGFGQLTLLFTAVGVLLARSIGRRASRPRTTLARTTLVLTALSLIPDVLLSTGPSTKATFMLTHVVAAAIVIPVLVARVPAERTA